MERMFRPLVVNVCGDTADVVTVLTSPIYFFAAVFSTVAGTGAQ